MNQHYVSRLEELIEKGQAVVRTFELPGPGVIGYGSVGAEEFTAWRVRSIACLEGLLGKDHAYTENFRTVVKNNSGTGSTEAGIGVLRAVLDDFRAGYLATLRELIHADVFSDLLDQADYLLSEGYKDPAAVLAGGVLEEHLRSLCRKHGIDSEVPSQGRSRPKKADRMNADLAKAGAYSTSDRKNVTSQLDIRNLAAHGKYSEYDKSQVDLMIRAVRDFLARVPA